jgi:ketosteroid isomerase-like protein
MRQPRAPELARRREASDNTLGSSALELERSSNIDLVRRLFEAFSRRDLEGMLALSSPDLEFFPQVTASRVNRTEPYIGHEGMRRYFEDVARVWRELEIIPHDFRDLGDQVLVTGRVYARGKGGYIADSPAQWLWRVEGGWVIWGRVFTSRSEAFEAAGLEP